MRNGFVINSPSHSLSFLRRKKEIEERKEKKKKKEEGKNGSKMLKVARDGNM
jgi:hypothetical protein